MYVNLQGFLVLEYGRNNVSILHYDKMVKPLKKQTKKSQQNSAKSQTS